MRRSLRLVAAAVGILSLGGIFWACSGDGPDTSDSNLPVRRAKMREVKISTDRIFAVLKNRALNGVAADARIIQGNLADVIDLYPPEHKAKYIDYNRTAQQRAVVLVKHAEAGSFNPSNKAFKEMVPYCGKCHEDCAYMLAPAFPEYEPE